MKPITKIGGRVIDTIILSGTLGTFWRRLMAWKRFSLKRVKSTSSPSATINKLGLIWFNRAAADLIGDSTIAYVEFFHHASTNRIGVRPLKEETEDSYKLTSLAARGSRKVFAAGFLKNINHSFSETRRYPVLWNGRTRMLVIDMTQGEPIGSSEDA